MDLQAPSQSQSEALVVAGVVAAVAVALYFGLGMPGMDHGDTKSSMDHGSPVTRQAQVSMGRTQVALLNPASFAARMGDNAVLLNVHVPFAGVTGEI